MRQYLLGLTNKYFFQSSTSDNQHSYYNTKTIKLQRKINFCEQSCKTQASRCLQSLRGQSHQAPS